MSTIPLWVAAHQVGFGAVKFMAITGRGWDDWIGEATVVTRRIPGGNASVTQFMGVGPEKVRYTLGLPSSSDFVALKALVGTRATLTVLDGVASTSGTTAVIGGRTYLQIPTVLLVSIDPASVIRRVAGHVICEAEFQR